MQMPPPARCWSPSDFTPTISHSVGDSRCAPERELRPGTSTVTWLGSANDEVQELGNAETTMSLLQSAREYAASQRVPLDGWGVSPKVLKTQGKPSQGDRIDLAGTCRLMLAISVEFLHGTFRGDPDGTASTGRLTRGEWATVPCAALRRAGGGRRHGEPVPCD